MSNRDAEVSVKLAIRLMQERVRSMEKDRAKEMEQRRDAGQPTIFSKGVLYAYERVREALTKIEGELDL